MFYFHRHVGLLFFNSIPNHAKISFSRLFSTEFWLFAKSIMQALAIQTANESKADLILANDPDADRLAVAERLSATEWKIFNGNEIAALLADWVWTHYKSSTKEDELGTRNTLDQYDR